MLAIVWGFGIVARLAIVTGFALGFISPVEPVYSPGCHAGMNREARLDRLVHADPKLVPLAAHLRDGGLRNHRHKAIRDREIGSIKDRPHLPVSG